MNDLDGFAAFWEHFPRKVGKLDAQKAYIKARQRGVTAEQLLDGVARYIQHKPAYADWCHPATWLNKGRYDDEYDHEPVTQRARYDPDQVNWSSWWDECKELHGGTCDRKYNHILRMRDEQAARERGERV